MARLLLDPAQRPANRPVRSSEVVRVSIVAENRAAAQALAELIEDDERIEVVEYRTGPFTPDVVVVADSQARSYPPGSSLVFLVDNEPQTFPAQGRAWLPSNVTAAELVAAVLAAAQDLTVLTTEQAQRRLPGHRESRYAANDVAEPLTGREQQVLRMLAQGLGNKEIAGQLGISDHTAKFHVAQILAKLNAASRTEAVAIAMRRGLVPI